MVFSASTFMQALFLFTLSFVLYLLASGFAVALYRYHWSGQAQKIIPNPQGLAHSGTVLIFGLMTSLGLSLLFSSFFTAYGPRILLFSSFAIVFYLFTRLWARFKLSSSFQISLFKGPIEISILKCLVALFCIFIAFVFFDQRPFFKDYFPIWVDRLLGAVVLFIFILIFERSSDEALGVQVGIGCLALFFGVSFFTLALEPYWLEFAFLLSGIGLAAYYWGTCFALKFLDKSPLLCFGLFFGPFLLELMTLGAVAFLLLLLVPACCYFLSPYAFNIIAHLRQKF